MTYENNAAGWLKHEMSEMKKAREEAEYAKSPEGQTAAKHAEVLRIVTNSSDAELRTVYGTSSLPLKANKIAIDRPELYAQIKAEVMRRGIYDRARPGK